MQHPIYTECQRSISSMVTEVERMQTRLSRENKNIHGLKQDFAIAKLRDALIACSDALKEHQTRGIEVNNAMQYLGKKVGAYVGDKYRVIDVTAIEYIDDNYFFRGTLIKHAEIVVRVDECVEV